MKLAETPSFDLMHCSVFTSGDIKCFLMKSMISKASFSLPSSILNVSDFTVLSFKCLVLSCLFLIYWFLIPFLDVYLSPFPHSCISPPLTPGYPCSDPIRSDQPSGPCMCFICLCLLQYLCVSHTDHTEYQTTACWWTQQNNNVVE